MPRTVLVTTGSRLHFGLFSFGRAAGRQYGGIGAMIARPNVRVRLTAADDLVAIGPLAERAMQSARLIGERLALPAAVRITIDEAPPEHVGLGTGTQLGLAIAAGLSKLAGRPLPTALELAAATGRAQRSAIGTYGFLQGGLLLEEGKDTTDSVSPLSKRVDFPAAWRFILVRPEAARGLSGDAEQDAFANLPPVSDSVESELRSLAAERLIPSAEAADFEAFSATLSAYSRIAGGCYATRQGGPFANSRMAQLAELMTRSGGQGVGQSSWGPTLFAIAPSEREAGDLVSRILSSASEPLDIFQTIPLNCGAEIVVEDYPVRAFPRQSDAIEMLPPRPTEQMLIDRIDKLALPNRPAVVLCTSLGRAQLAVEVAQRHGLATVMCHYFDLFAASLARRAVPPGLSNLSITCAADWQVSDCDVVALPLTMTGDAEFTQELLQLAHQALRIGGQLWATTDNPDDSWLRERIATIFDQVTREGSSQGVVYIARKTAPLKKVKKFTCEFAFREGDRLVRAVSRPGVFAHRRLDAGARQLIREIRGMAHWILDLGCGSGCVSLAAASPGAIHLVHAVDSNPRAIECVERGAALNGVSDFITTELTTLDAPVRFAGSFSLVLANPPYFGHFEIAERFLVAAHAALEPSGLLTLVTKQPDWYVQNAKPWFGEVGIEPAGQYWLVHGRRT